MGLIRNSKKMQSSKCSRELEWAEQRSIYEYFLGGEESMANIVAAETQFARRLLPTPIKYLADPRTQLFTCSPNQFVIISGVFPIAAFHIRNLAQRALFLDPDSLRSEFQNHQYVHPLQEAKVIARMSVAFDASIETQFTPRGIKCLLPDARYTQNTLSPLADAFAVEGADDELLSFHSFLPFPDSEDLDVRSLNLRINCMYYDDLYFDSAMKTIQADFINFHCTCQSFFGDNEDCHCLKLFEEHIFVVHQGLLVFPRILDTFTLYLPRILNIVLNEFQKLPEDGQDCCAMCLEPRDGEECSCISIHDVISLFFTSSVLHQLCGCNFEDYPPEFNPARVMEMQRRTIGFHMTGEAIRMLEEFGRCAALMGTAFLHPYSAEEDLAAGRPYSKVINVKTMVTLVTKSLTLFIYLNEIKTDPQVYRDKCHAILQLLLNIRGHLGVTMAICNELDDLEIYTNFHRIFYHPQESGLNPSVAKTFEIYQSGFLYRQSVGDVIQLALGLMASVANFGLWQVVNKVYREDIPPFNEGDEPDISMKFAEGVIDVLTRMSKDLKSVVRKVEVIEVDGNTIKTRELSNKKRLRSVGAIQQSMKESCTFCGAEWPKKTCSTCKVAKYCSEKCKKRWNRSHALVCHQDKNEVIQRFCSIPYHEAAEAIYEDPQLKRVRQDAASDGNPDAEQGPGAEVFQQWDEVTKINMDVIQECWSKKLELMNQSPIFDPVCPVHRCAFPL